MKIRALVGNDESRQRDGGHRCSNPDPLLIESLEALRGKYIAVTGGAGFCGINLVRTLAPAAAEIRVLDDASTGDIRAVEAIDGATLLQGSVLDTDALDTLLDGIDVVFHLSCRNIIVSVKDPEEDLMVNAVGTLRVLAAAVRASVSRVVYSSSASVYGNARYLPVNEDDQKSLLNPYAVSKYAAEGYCRVMAEMHDLPFTILRYSNVYGPHQSTFNPYCGVVGRFIEAALAGEPLRIHGDGEQTRDYTYIDDAVSATLAASWKPQAVDAVYNVGSGRETSVNELAAKTLRATGASEDLLTWIEARSIDNIRRRALNIERIRQDLRWIPRHTIDTGLIKTVEWVRSQAREESRAADLR